MNGTRHLMGVIDGLNAEQKLLRAERDRLREVNTELLAALRRAAEEGCSTVYATEYDEIGDKGCCGAVEYHEHRDGCWVLAARAAIAKAERGA